MQKATVQASPDVALIKYWGKKDSVLRIPANGNVSMILDGLQTVTTVSFDSTLKNDEVTIDGQENILEKNRVIDHLDRLRRIARVDTRAKVVSLNSFPRGTGLSSSGSGFAALTIAALQALGIEMSKRDISILARFASGTACRCVNAGFVEWHDGETSDDSYAETIFSYDHWDLADVIVVVDHVKKKVSSIEGHQLAHTSVFFRERLRNIDEKINSIKKIITQKKFRDLGLLVEQECLEFHAILLTSKPSVIAWLPGTIDIINRVQALRSNGIDAYFTISTGFNVHVLTTKDNEEIVQDYLRSSPFASEVILAKVGQGPKVLSDHLF